MRRTYNYIFPIAIGAAVILSMFIGYGLYERGQMSFGLLASVGASLLFIAEYVLEVVLVKNRKYGFAIAVSIIKYFVLIIGLMTVFKNALSGMVLLFFFLFIPGYNMLFFAYLFGVVPMLAICFILVQVGTIVEPILLCVEKKKLYVRPRHLACDDI